MRVPLPRGTLLATVIAGIAAAVFIPLDRPGIGWGLAGLAAAGAVYTVDRRARRTHDVPSPAPGEDESRSATPKDDCASTLKQETPSRWKGVVWWTAITLGLLAVGVFRAAEWLFVLCPLGAAVTASLAVVRRSASGLLYDVIAVPLSAFESVPWLYRGIQRLPVRKSSSAQRVGWSVLATVLLLAVFIPLLAGADAVFAQLIESVTPQFDGASGARWVFVFTVAALAVAGALYLLAAPPLAAGESNSVAARLIRKHWSRLEWALPLGALTVLFTVFVATQLAVLFGGNGYVQRTAELTYAEYARSGFWQLSIVSMLTLAVIAAVQAWAAQESAVDRRWLRILVSAVSVLTLVIVASALHRMWTYQQAYGFTVLRLLVEVFELWIGFVYLLVLASLVKLRRDWVPRAAVGAAAATLLALAGVNPEGLIAERNIDRWLAGKTVTTTGGRQVKPDLDLDYLSGLSADALPAVERLPEPRRSQIAATIRADLEADTWQGWNWSRAAAR
ncbi:DUF4153 domain-containing protein [Nocardia sp. XZ_19_385]|uniref:DUF4153 domain-containing protein n=1 Tax=Nocardia sp. XZ_19_385 TaxID=2769488 RepID=UPI00188F2F59|nr:DUF4173 domain-containing protein [Nocardia sp. XZ_19_385]